MGLTKIDDSFEDHQLLNSKTNFQNLHCKGGDLILHIQTVNCAL